MSSAVQRWRAGRESYRPVGEPIRVADYDVGWIAGDVEARAFVLAHHYSSSYPAARFRVGLVDRGGLCGVAVFSVPAQPRSLDCLPGAGVELGRFVLLDRVPANGETWFLARCFDMLRGEGVVGVVSFSDPTPRLTADGRVVHRGHVGTIYQAHNGVYLGRSKPRVVQLLPDGTLLHPRALAKLRAGHRGRRYVAALLERHGADPLGSGDAEVWLRRWLPRLTRPLRHPGNLKYAWVLDRRLRRRLPESLPYVKQDGGSAWNCG